MSFENQLGSVLSRLRAIEDSYERLQKQLEAIEFALEVEKANLAHCLADLQSIQAQLRPKESRT